MHLCDVFRGVLANLVLSHNVGTMQHTWHDACHVLLAFQGRFVRQRHKAHATCERLVLQCACCAFASRMFACKCSLAILSLSLKHVSPTQYAAKRLFECYKDTSDRNKAAEHNHFCLHISRPCFFGRMKQSTRHQHGIWFPHPKDNFAETRLSFWRHLS